MTTALSLRRLGETLDLVGECPIWDQRCGRLIWVDIVGKAIRWLELGTGQTGERQVDDFPTALALTETVDQVMLTKGRQFGRLDLPTGAFHAIAEVEAGRETMRLNEGSCDPAGRFWTSSMENNLHPDGSPRAIQGSHGQLFSITGDEISAPLVTGLSIPNTMAWSPAGNVFYFGDTARNFIWAFDFEPASGVLSNRRIFADGGPGLPDGSTVDADGFLWNARFAAGCVIRFAPDGRQELVLPLPVTNPTACTFGGPSLDMLFVTSAHYGLDKPGPLDGALLAVDAKVRGQPSNIFRAAPRPAVSG